MGRAPDAPPSVGSTATLSGSRRPRPDFGGGADDSGRRLHGQGDRSGFGRRMRRTGRPSCTPGHRRHLSDGFGQEVRRHPPRPDAAHLRRRSPHRHHGGERGHARRKIQTAVVEKYGDKPSNVLTAKRVPESPRHHLGHLAPVRRATLPGMRRLLITVVALGLAGCGDSGDSTGSVQASTTAQSAPVATTAVRTATTGASGRVQYAGALQEIEACYLSSEFTSSSVQQSAEALNVLTPPSGFELRHRELIAELLAASRLTSVAQGSAVGTAGAHMDNLAREADPASQNPTPGRCAGLTPPVPRTR